MTKDIHNSPFEDHTLAKLSIFKDYLKEWLPVFLAKKEIYYDKINIFDFFAGPGSDSTNQKGSPLIIIDTLEPYLPNITNKNLKVHLYFNEKQLDKYQRLRKNLQVDNQNLKPYSVEVQNLDFVDAFNNCYPAMKIKGSANLLFLDQYGIKHINEDIFNKITNLRTTDFLFFISSSTIKRFADLQSIRQYINLSPSQVAKTEYHNIHRLVLNYYKSLIPKEKEYYLASFSLKKGSGVYGLIFGSNHVLGIEKFLKTCWKLDPERGEANFDIDQDNIRQGQLDLFTNEVRKPKKVDAFNKDLKENILNGNLRTDKDIYLYTLNHGFTIEQTRKIIAQLEKDNRIIKYTLDLSSKVCKSGAVKSNIKLIVNGSI